MLSYKVVSITLSRNYFYQWKMLHSQLDNWIRKNLKLSKGASLVALGGTHTSQSKKHRPQRKRIVFEVAQKGPK